VYSAVRKSFLMLFFVILPDNVFHHEGHEEHEECIQADPFPTDEANIGVLRQDKRMNGIEGEIASLAMTGKGKARR